MNYYCDTLQGETELHQGHCLFSRNNAYFLKVNEDGNILLYVSSHFVPKNIIWTSKTEGLGKGPFYLRCQNDGNLCLYDTSGAIIWSSQTWNTGRAPYRLTIQNDGNLILFDNENKNIWCSGTSRS